MTSDHRLRLAAAGLHPDRRRALVGRCGSAAAAVEAIVRGSVRVPDEARHAVSRTAEELRAACDAAGVSILDIGDPGYPPALADLPDRPDVLFLRGAVPPAGQGVAIVGTRRCTAYGIGIARRFGAVVAAAGWPVVSGLARGIDGAAHEGSLEGPGAPIAVLGCGPDVVYPSEHRRLAGRIIETGGSIVSEYPPGARPLPWRFPPRNRIIAALAGVVVVVESADRGGALVTAAAGAELGRTVLAVPGDVDRTASRGCNLLLRDGALPVLGAEDLVEAVSLALGLPGSIPAAEPSDPMEQAVLEAASAGLGLEELVARLGVDAGSVLAAVSRLEIAGRLGRRDGLIVGR